jgi:outer membrane protein assembly factor BamB
VVIGRTTICCASALFCVGWASLSAQSAREAASFFPASTIWTVALKGALAAPPGFHGARGYFALQTDRLEAYDLTTGKPLWTTELRLQWRPIVGDVLLFAAGPEALVALRADDGQPAWKQVLPEPLATQPIWSDGWLITVSQSGTVSGRRAVDGEVIWQRDVESPASAPPALALDRIYVPVTDGRVIALRLETGDPIWTRRLGGAPQGILASDERLYAGALDNFFYCLNVDDGRIDWRWRTGGDVIGLPVLDDRRVYFVSLDNLLRGLGRNSGVQQWRAPLSLRPNTGPVKAGDWLIVSGVSPTLHAYALSNGAAAGHTEAPGDLAAPPHVIDNDGASITIVVVTRDIVKGTTVTALGKRAEGS